MTKRVQLVRHDNAGANQFLGKLGEISVNTGNKSVHVHDALTQGGTELARADVDNVAVASSGNAGKMSAQQASELVQTLIDVDTAESLLINHTAEIAANDAEILTLQGETGSLQTQVTSNDGDITSLQSVKADKVVPVTVGNVPTLDVSGNLVDGAKTIAELLARANHTGTQLLSTISDSGVLAALNTVSQAEVGVAAIGQAETKTSFGVVSTLSQTGVLLTLAGGQYGFYPQIKESTGTSANHSIGIKPSGLDSGASQPDFADVVLGTSYVTRIAMAAAINTVYALQRYFLASPPYILNPQDGEVGRFIFALINNTTSKVESVYQAPEAPWHYNGKTDIRGKLGRDGKKYRLRKDMSAVPFTFEMAKKDPVKLAEYTAAFHAAPSVPELITQEIYQRDMSDIPHAFTGNDLTGKTVVMLNPVSDFNHELNCMCNEFDEFDLNKLLHDDYFSISSQGLKLTGPAGVLISDFKWKNTK